ncbi:MAG TPA: hypothetical protein VGA07_04100 [Anaerolineales bacterium]
MLLGREGVYVEQNAQVLSGDVGANVSSPGPYLAEGSEVTIGIGADLLDPASRVLGDSVYLKDNSQVYDVYYNELGGLGEVLGEHHTPVQLPLVSAFPDVPMLTPGSQDFDVSQGGLLTLDAGSYGLLKARLGSRRPAFEWEPVAGATSYTLHVSTNDAFSKLLIKITVAGTAFGAPANLPLGKVLDRRVQANSINGPSAWSGVWSFLIVP